MPTLWRCSTRNGNLIWFYSHHSGPALSKPLYARLQMPRRVTASPTCRATSLKRPEDTHKNFHTLLVALPYLLAALELYPTQAVLFLRLGGVQTWFV